MTTPRPVISTLEAAALLEISHATVRRLWESGELQGYKTSQAKGARLRLYRDSVERYAQEREKPATRQEP